MSWARQLTSRADVLGSSPKRTVPDWWATPASGMRLSRIDQAGMADVPVGLGEHLNVPERQPGVGGTPVVVVDSERLLELRRVGRLRDGDDAGVDVGHVMASDNVR